MVHTKKYNITGALATGIQKAQITSAKNTVGNILLTGGSWLWIVDVVI